jgi:DNA-binding ferritin-like protein (Dps family)
MATKIDMRAFEKLLDIHKERNLAMIELSNALGQDISFSDEEIMNFALEDYSKLIEKQINAEVESWMKSVLS